MSRLYELKEDDDIREIRMTLDSTPTPSSAILILSKGSVREERALTEDSGEWTYRFEDSDFSVLAAGTYKAEVYATFIDGTNGTYPTVGTLTVRIYARL